jgi:hypothetical protein
MIVIVLCSANQVIVLNVLCWNDTLDDGWVLERLKRSVDRAHYSTNWLNLLGLTQRGLMLRFDLLVKSWVN